MQQTVDAIVYRMRTDPEFAQRYRRLDSFDAIKAQAKQDGLDVDSENIAAIIEALGGSREMNETDLASISGGGGGVPGHEDLSDPTKRYCNACDSGAGLAPGQLCLSCWRFRWPFTDF